MLAWLACLAGIAPPRGRAQGAANRSALLVASPSLEGGMFARSVVLVMRTPVDETIGVILNQPQDPSWPAEFASPDAAGRVPGVYRGGPLSPGAYFALAESAGAPDGTLAAAQGVRFAAGAANVKRLIAAAAEGRIKLFRGYAGWAPGQLADEVAAGAWSARVPDADLLFDADPATLWRRLDAARRVV